MKEFLTDDFLLQNETAKILYHEFAKNMPIIDFHSHLSAKEIYENKQFSNISDVWLVTISCNPFFPTKIGKQTR